MARKMRLSLTVAMIMPSEPTTLVPDAMHFCVLAMWNPFGSPMIPPHRIPAQIASHKAVKTKLMDLECLYTALRRTSIEYEPAGCATELMMLIALIRLEQWRIWPTV